MKFVNMNTRLFPSALFLLSVSFYDLIEDSYLHELSSEAVYQTRVVLLHLCRQHSLGSLLMVPHNQTVWVPSHGSPDPDSLGSLLLVHQTQIVWVPHSVILYYYFQLIKILYVGITFLSIHNINNTIYQQHNHNHPKII